MRKIFVILLPLLLLAGCSPPKKHLIPYKTNFAYNNINGNIYEYIGNKWVGTGRKIFFEGDWDG